MFYVFSSTKSENRKLVQVLLWGRGSVLTLVGGGGSREEGKRVNIVQIMYTHVCKYKNDIYKTVLGIRGGRDEEEQWKG
jgi:hypothetical protein